MAREVYPTEAFKKYSKYFVFVKINSDHQQAVARAYNVSSLPDIKFMKADGTVVHEIGGYMPLHPFIGEMEKGKQAAGF